MRLSELKRRRRLSDVRGRRLKENSRYAVRGKCGSLWGVSGLSTGHYSRMGAFREGLVRCKGVGYKVRSLICHYITSGICDMLHNAPG